MALPLAKKGEDSSAGTTTGASLWSQLPLRRRGYDRAATEALLDELASKHAELERECGKLREQVTQLEADLARHRGQEQLVSKTLLEASSHATTIREKAREEAELILRKASAELGERAALTERAEREQADAERELLRLGQLAQEMQQGLAGFLTQTLAQLQPQAGPGTPEHHAAGDGARSLSALEAPLKQKGDEPGSGDALRPSSGEVAPPRQGS